tara:strand:+ start:350 stop:529 length:180 start_codon:yes stop_codon:yes gene_type:complete
MNSDNNIASPREELVIRARSALRFFLKTNDVATARNLVVNYFDCLGYPPAICVDLAAIA